MMLSALNPKRLERITRFMAQHLERHPLFMYFCPQPEQRSRFIRLYFSYFLPRWARQQAALADPSGHTVAVLTKRRSFESRFTGRYALRLHTQNGKRVLLHGQAVQDTVDLILPESMDAQVLTLFAQPEHNPQETADVIQEAMAKAKAESFVLVYETFSQRMIPVFEYLGFETAYQRLFPNTQFMQTLMVYNLE